MRRKPKISICVNTWQELYPMFGVNLDIFTLLIKCLEAQSFKDFELVIVDREYKKRKEIFSDIRKSFGIKYVPPKRSPWESLDKNAITIANAKNSALCLCSGDWTIMLDDCEVPTHEDWLAQIWDYAQDSITLKPIVHMCDFRHKPVKVDTDPIVGWMRQQKPQRSYYQASGHSRAYSFRTLVYEFLNGFDERFDGGWGSEDCNFFERIDKFKLIRHVLGNDRQHALALISHHPNLLYGKYSGRICNEAYAMYTYGNINRYRELQANVKLLEFSDIESIRSKCNSCALRKGGMCKLTEPPNLNYYLEIQPVFDLAQKRREVLNVYGNTYGAFNPWE